MEGVVFTGKISLICDFIVDIINNIIHQIAGVPFLLLPLQGIRGTIITCGAMADDTCYDVHTCNLCCDVCTMCTVWLL